LEVGEDRCEEFEIEIQSGFLRRVKVIAEKRCHQPAESIR
jgi:hypothetical protein